MKKLLGLFIAIFALIYVIASAVFISATPVEALRLTAPSNQRSTNQVTNWPNTPCLWGNPNGDGWSKRPSVCNNQYKNTNQIKLTTDPNAQVTGDFIIYGVNGDKYKKTDRRQITIQVVGANNTISINGQSTNKLTIDNYDKDTLDKHPYVSEGLEGGTKRITITGQPNSDGIFAITATSPSDGPNYTKWLGGYKGDSVLLGPVTYTIVTPTPTPTPTATNTPTPTNTPNPTPTTVPAPVCVSAATVPATNKPIAPNSRVKVTITGKNANNYRIIRADNSSVVYQGSKNVATITANPNITYRAEVSRQGSNYNWFGSNNCNFKFNAIVIPTPTPTNTPTPTPTPVVYPYHSVNIWGDPYTTISSKSMTIETDGSILSMINDGKAKPLGEWVTPVDMVFNLPSQTYVVFKGTHYQAPNKNYHCELHTVVSQPKNQKNNVDGSPLEHVTAAAVNCSNGQSVYIGNLGHRYMNGQALDPMVSINYQPAQPLSRIANGNTGVIQYRNGTYYLHASDPKITQASPALAVKVDGIEYIFAQISWNDGRHYSGLIRTITDNTVDVNRVSGYFANGLQGKQPAAVSGYYLSAPKAY